MQSVMDTPTRSAAPLSWQPPLERADDADYAAFLRTKQALAPEVGERIDPATLHPQMKPHQRAITAWACRVGRAAVWADTGLGKTLIFLEWARQLPGRTLILAPLGVALQLATSEAPRWGIPVTYARSEAEAPASGITVTNYDRLDRFALDRWPKVVLDEADILANWSGTTKRALVAGFRAAPYRLTATATPAPNDVVELCNQADFLSVMPQKEMLSRFFTPKGMEQSANGNYRLKPHACRDFYRWLATWAVACKQPSDLGYADDEYLLPELSIRARFVPVSWAPAGQLFLTQLKGVTERAGVRRDTLTARVDAAAEIIAAAPTEQWLAWYGLIAEAEALAQRFPDAIVLRGSDPPERKESVLLSFARGEIAKLITHHKIAGAGMNFQTCARQLFIGLGDSYRAYYQCIRRSWRFGQTRPVQVWIVLSEPERAVYENVLRKERTAADLSRELVAAMQDFERLELAGRRDASDPYTPAQAIVWPTWLRRNSDV